MNSFKYLKCGFVVMYTLNTMKILGCLKPKADFPGNLSRLYLRWHFQAVQTDAAGCVDVGVVDGRQESHLGRLKRIPANRVHTSSAVNLKGIWPRRVPKVRAVHAAGGLGFFCFVLLLLEI